MLPEMMTPKSTATKAPIFSTPMTIAPELDEDPVPMEELLDEELLELLPNFAVEVMLLVCAETEYPPDEQPETRSVNGTCATLPVVTVPAHNMQLAYALMTC